MEAGVWGYNWVTLSLGRHIQSVQGWELDARLATLLYNKNLCCKIHRSETRMQWKAMAIAPLSNIASLFFRWPATDQQLQFVTVVS